MIVLLSSLLPSIVTVEVRLPFSFGKSSSGMEIPSSLWLVCCGYTDKLLRSCQAGKDSFVVVHVIIPFCPMGITLVPVNSITVNSNRLLYS